jgi:hypothetical protein
MMKHFQFLSIALLSAAIVFTGCDKKEEENPDNPNRVDLKRDLQLHLTFDDGTCNDISGKNHHGVASGNVQFVTNTPNGVGMAARIDGTQQQFINVPYALINDSTGFSINLWVRDFATGPLVATVGNYLNSPSIVGTIDNKLRVYHYSDNYYKDLLPSLNSYQASGWHMLTVTGKKNQEVIVYIDGQKADAASISSVDPNGQKFQIGGNADGNFDRGRWADPMTVDNVRVYGRSINAKEVEELYKTEANMNGGTDDAATNRGLLNYYTFDNGNANNTALDHAHGNLSGNPTYITDTPNGRGQALQLEGTKEQSVDIPENLLDKKKAFSICFWIKDFATGPIISTVANYLNSPTIRVTTENKLMIYHNSDNYYKEMITSMDNYMASGWHHFAVTGVNNGQLVLYIDGQRMDATSISAMESVGTRIQIGGNAYGKFNAWADKMKIDNVRIHSVALTEKEVRAIFEMERN